MGEGRLNSRNDFPLKRPVGLLLLMLFIILVVHPLYASFTSSCFRTLLSLIFKDSWPWDMSMGYSQISGSDLFARGLRRQIRG